MGLGAGINWHGASGNGVRRQRQIRLKTEHRSTEEPVYRTTVFPPPQTPRLRDSVRASLLAGTMQLNHSRNEVETALGKLHRFHSGGLATRTQGKWVTEGISWRRRRKQDHRKVKCSGLFFFSCFLCYRCHQCYPWLNSSA